MLGNYVMGHKKVCCLNYPTMDSWVILAGLLNHGDANSTQYTRMVDTKAHTDSLPDTRVQT